MWPDDAPGSWQITYKRGLNVVEVWEHIWVAWHQSGGFTGVWHRVLFKRDGTVEHRIEGDTLPRPHDAITPARQLFEQVFGDYFMAVTQVLRKLPAELERRVWTF